MTNDEIIAAVILQLGPPTGIMDRMMVLDESYIKAREAHEKYLADAAATIMQLRKGITVREVVGIRARLYAECGVPVSSFDRRLMEGPW